MEDAGARDDAGVGRGAPPEWGKELPDRVRVPLPAREVAMATCRVRGGCVPGWVRTPLPAMEGAGVARDEGGERRASQRMSVWRISLVEFF